MPETRLKCPSCDAVVKTAAALFVGKSIKCPKCHETIKVRAADLDDEDHDDEEPRRSKSKKGMNDRSKAKFGGQPLGVWLGIGGGVLVVVMVVLAIVLGGKRGGNKGVDRPGDPVPEAKEGGGSTAYTVARRIETNIPLPQREPYILIRGILGLSASADASVIGVTSALSPRRYTINRATGKVIAEFDEMDARDAQEAQFGREVYTGQPLVSPDSKLLIVRTHHRHNTFKIRDVATGIVVKALGGDPITHFGKLEFSRNGDMLYALARGNSGNVLIGWRGADWQQVCHIKIPENREPVSLFPLADGKTVVTFTRHNSQGKPQADFYDVREQKFIRAFVLASWRDTGPVAVSPDGKLLAVVGNNGDFNRALEIYDMDIAKHISTVVESKDITQPGGPRVDGFPESLDMRFLPSGRLAVVGSHIHTGHFVATHDPKTGAQKAVWKHEGKIGGRQITHLSICANGEILMVLDGETATILIARLKE